MFTKFSLIYISVPSSVSQSVSQQHSLINLAMFSQLWVGAKVSEGSQVLQMFRRSKPTLAASSEVVKNFQEIPSPPSWPVLGHLTAFMKNERRLDRYASELQAQYGDMVRLHFPTGSGNNSMVMLFKPQHIKSLYTEEERIPKIPGLGAKYHQIIMVFSPFHVLGFDVTEYSREFDLKSRFKSKGLITNSVRKL